MCYCDPSNPFTGKSCGKEKCRPWEYQEAMRELTAERDALKAKIETARNQEPYAEWRVFNKGGSGQFGQLVSNHPMYDGLKLYTSPVLAQQEPCGYMCEDAGITTIYNAAKCTGDFSKHTPVYKSPVPAQQAESPWHVITNENWNIPKLGQRVILFSNGAIQNDSYTLDRGDDGYFWSRDDVDECPEVKAGDAWMPWPSEIKGGENER